MHIFFRAHSSVMQGAVWFDIHAESNRVEMKAPCQQPRSFTATPSETLIQVQSAALRGDAPSAAPLRGTPAKCSELLQHPTTYVKKSAYYAHYAFLGAGEKCDRILLMKGFHCRSIKAANSQQLARRRIVLTFDVWRWWRVPSESLDILTAPKWRQHTLREDVCEPRHVGDRNKKKKVALVHNRKYFITKRSSWNWGHSFSRVSTTTLYWNHKIVGFFFLFFFTILTGGKKKKISH